MVGAFLPLGCSNQQDQSLLCRRGASIIVTFGQSAVACRHQLCVYICTSDWVCWGVKQHSAACIEHL